MLCSNGQQIFVFIEHSQLLLDRELRTGGGMSTTRMMRRVKPPVCAQRGPTGQQGKPQR